LLWWQTLTSITILFSFCRVSGSTEAARELQQNARATQLVQTLLCNRIRGIAVYAYIAGRCPYIIPRVPTTHTCYIGQLSRGVINNKITPEPRVIASGKHNIRVMQPLCSRFRYKRAGNRRSIRRFHKDIIYIVKYHVRNKREKTYTRAAREDVAAAV